MAQKSRDELKRLAEEVKKCTPGTYGEAKAWEEFVDIATPDAVLDLLAERQRMRELLTRVDRACREYVDQSDDKVFDEIESFLAEHP